MKQCTHCKHRNFFKFSIWIKHGDICSKPSEKQIFVLPAHSKCFCLQFPSATASPLGMGPGPGPDGLMPAGYYPPRSGQPGPSGSTSQSSPISGCFHSVMIFDFHSQKTWLRLVNVNFSVNL